MKKRIPLTEEPISEMDAVVQYDRGARLYMLPEYRYFVWKILHRGLREGRVLDIGTGSGLLAIELARVKNSNFRITALDVSANMLKQARRNARRAGVEDRIEFILANADTLPFPDRTFDLVMSYASLHHWFRPALVFSESQRIVKETGTVIIRDNQRVSGQAFWDLFVNALRLFMNKRHRANWPKVIEACYTIPEVQEILKESSLKNYRVCTDFIHFDISIETANAETTMRPAA